MKPATEEKLNEWRALLEERKQKGLTVKEFCKEKNISPAQFYYYQKTINKSDQSQSNYKMVKEKIADIKPIQIINSVSKENNFLRFILPNSLQCILPRDMPIDEIKKILELVLSC